MRQGFVERPRRANGDASKLGSVVVRRLVERGLVVRTPLLADKRRIALDVTPAGRALLAEAPKTVQRQLIEGLAALPVDRQIELADLMEQWLQASGVDLAHPPMIGEEGAHGSARRFE